MNRSKIAAFFLTAALMITGTGYAYWSDSLTVNSNVSTGKLDVQFVKPHFAFSELMVSEFMFSNPVQRDENTVQFSLGNLYPGAAFLTFTEMKNYGSIPAKFGSAEVSFEGDDLDILKEDIYVSMDCHMYSKDNKVTMIIPNKTRVKLSELEDMLNQSLKNIKLEPGSYLCFGDPRGESVDQFMTYVLSTDSDNSSEDRNITFRIKFNWKQFNQ